MTEHIIASGVDLHQYILSSNRAYNCKISGGIGIKKNGYVEFESLQCSSFFISLRKISGNGKLYLKYNNISQPRQIHNVDKIFIENLTGPVRIERTHEAIGDISVLFIGCVIETNMNEVLQQLNKCKYSGIRVIDNKIVANANGYIEGFTSNDTIETIPNKAYIIQGNRITFPIQCIITGLKIKYNTKKNAAEHIIQNDLNQTNLMNMLDKNNPTNVATPPTMTAIQTTIPTTFKRNIIFNSDNNNFSNIIRKFGGYKLLTNKNKKILSLMAASEVQIPVTSGSGNFYCIETNVRSGSRSFFQYYVGFEAGGVIHKSPDIRCSNKLNINKFYVNIAATNSVCKLILGVNKRQKDFANIHDIKIYEITNEEYLGNVQPSNEFINNVLSKQNGQNSIDLEKLLNMLKLHVSDEEKLAPLSLPNVYSFNNISININELEQKINTYNNFVLCIGNLWNPKDFDLFQLTLEAYNINVIRIFQYNYNRNHFEYTASKALGVVCENRLQNDITKTITARILDSRQPFQNIIDQLLNTKFEKPKYNFEEYLEQNNITIKKEEIVPEAICPLSVDNVDNMDDYNQYSQEDVRFKIIIPCYNNEDWISKTLESIITQDYKKYDICIVDDCSASDQGRNIIKFYCEKYNNSFNKWQYIFNPIRKNSLFNIVNGTNQMGCKDHDVIVNIDGDDWLAHNKVLNKLNDIYKSQKIYLTYGQYQYYPNGNKGHCKSIPEKIKQRNMYRNYEWVSSHLRTYKYLLFKNIKDTDFLDNNGKFYTMAGDLALMYPMLEMSGGKFYFVDDILYIYNRQTNLNDDKVNVKLQLSSATSIRKKPRYKPIV